MPTIIKRGALVVIASVAGGALAGWFAGASVCECAIVTLSMLVAYLAMELRNGT